MTVFIFLNKQNAYMPVVYMCVGGGSGGGGGWWVVGRCCYVGV